MPLSISSKKIKIFTVTHHEEVNWRAHEDISMAPERFLADWECTHVSGESWHIHLTWRLISQIVTVAHSFSEDADCGELYRQFPVNRPGDVGKSFTITKDMVPHITRATAFCDRMEDMLIDTDVKITRSGSQVSWTFSRCKRKTV